MSQPFADALSWVPKSRGLAMTLARAFDYAKDQSHRTVSLEHLLLALITDADASVVLQACQIDLNGLNDAVSSYLAETDEHLAPGESAESATSPDLMRIIEYAAAAAKQSRRQEVNGAIVLAAIVGDGRTPAAGMLRDQGLTFEEAIKALQKTSVSARNTAQPPPQRTPEPRPPATEPPESAAAQSRQAEPAYPSQSAEREPEPQVPHGGRAHGNGATGQTTEDILAAARRRVGAGLNGNRPAPAPAPPPQAWEPPPRPDEPRQRVADRHPFEEPQYSAPPPPDMPSEEQFEADDPGEGFQASARDDTLPAGTLRPSPPDPLQHSERPSASRPDRGASTRRPPPAPPDEAPHHWPPPRPQADPYAPPPAPTLDWPSYPADGHYAPQTSRRADGSRLPPPPPRMPPPRHYPAESARTMQPPWSEPPAPPVPRSPQQSARPPASPRPSPDARRVSAVERPTTTQVSAGQLVENIPRSMTVGVPELVEVSIARAEVAALAERLQGSGTAYRHELVVTKAMSVRLRAPEGGFWIETASPETQWIENALGLLSDDFASWRWMVTPQRRGRARLQLIVSARTVGADGLAAETALPDQVIEVKVRTNYRRTAMQWGGWIAAALVGGILAKFGEGLWFIGSALLMQLGLI